MTTLISLTELLDRRTAGSVTLVEALSADFYAAGHLPEAMNLPLSSTDDDIQAQLRKLRSPIVVYGTSHGGEARELAERIETIIGREVMVLTGGKESWAEAGHPLAQSSQRRSEAR